MKYRNIKEPLIKSLHNALSDGFSSVGSDAYGFNQCFLNEPLIKSLHNALSDGFSSVGSDAYGFNQCFLNTDKE